MNCKVCEKTYHHCSSCYYEAYGSEGYCSRECYEKSEEWKQYAPKFLNFYNSLSIDQRLEFFSLWDNGILEDTKWENYIYKLFEDPTKDQTI